jgi:hypothetical protein
MKSSNWWRLQEIELSNEDQLAEFSIETNNTVNNHNNEYTSDIIHMYVALNNTYRIKAYDSLDSVKEIQSMNEFKLKLLFSVVIVSKFKKLQFCFSNLILSILNLQFLKKPVIIELMNNITHIFSRKVNLIEAIVLILCE